MFRRLLCGFDQVLENRRGLEKAFRDYEQKTKRHGADPRGPTRRTTQGQQASLSASPDDHCHAYVINPAKPSSIWS